MLGYCKECGAAIFETDEIPGTGLYECCRCYYLNSKSELWDEVPDYLKPVVEDK
jgi:DNA-directed RNA polymerase subunit M/transcription elongation factor TFIIS